METQSLTVPVQVSPPVEGRLAKTAGYYAAFIALGLVSASLGPTLPGLAQQTHVSLSAISLLFTARAFGYLLGALGGGRLYDRMPGHPLMAAGLGSMAIMMACVPFAPLLAVLIGVMFLIGVFESLIDIGGNTLIVWVHRREVGPFMNGLHFFFGVGAFLSPLVVAQAMSLSDGISLAYWLLALVMLPVAASVWRIPNPIPQTVAQNTGAGAANLWLVAGIALFMFLYAGAEVSFGGWIYTYAVTLHVADQALAAYLTSAFWGALTVGRLLAIPLAARFTPGVILFSNLAGCLASIGLLILAPPSFVTIGVGAIGLGLFMAPIFPTTLSFSERQMTITGKVTGWFFMGASAGAMTLPWLIGQLFEGLGPQTLMVTILAALLGAAVILTSVWVYSKRHYSA